MNIPATERLGVTRLGALFAKVGWFFREQFVHDVGIDAQVEIIENNISTGKLIAIQIKTGESYFKETSNNSIVYRPDLKHIEYWLKYSIPVIVVLYNPKDDIMLWIPIYEKTITKTGVNYKIEIPQDSILTENNYSALKNVFKLNYTQNRMTKLLLDYSWMKMINDGETVYAEFEDWKNKSLKRTSVKIYCDSKSGYKELYIPQHYAPGYSVFEEIGKIIPWAKFEMDVDSYLKAKEDNETYYTESPDEFYREPDGIIPISGDNEIDVYSVILKLNILGEAFLVIAEYLFSSPRFEWTSFSVDEAFTSVGVTHEH